MHLSHLSPTARNELVAMLMEVSGEITRVNTAAGETVFNPSATSGLRSVLSELESEPTLTLPLLRVRLMDVEPDDYETAALQAATDALMGHWRAQYMRAHKGYGRSPMLSVSQIALTMHLVAEVAITPGNDRQPTIVTIYGCDLARNVVKVTVDEVQSEMARSFQKLSNLFGEKVAESVLFSVPDLNDEPPF